MFHNDFLELETCGGKGCVTCRVFQRTFYLGQNTKKGMDGLKDLKRQDRVWDKLHLSEQNLLTIGTGDPP